MAESVNTFKIESDQLTLEIAIADISKLHPHEETIAEATEKLAQWFKKDGFVRDPVIVDKASFVILDGMHRVTAAKSIGCIRIPVCLVDYDSPSIRIGTWYRSFRGTSSALLKELIRRCDYNLCPTEIEKAEGDIEMKKAVGFLADSEKCFLVCNSELNVHESYQAISRIEEEAKKHGLNVQYETAKDASAKLETGQLGALLGPRRISKEDVRRYGSADDPFPHKATRHMIPARPLRVDVPLESLKDSNSNLWELNERLIDDLYRRNLKRVPPGALIEGRRYEEKVFIFE